MLVVMEMVGLLLLGRRQVQVGNGLVGTIAMHDHGRGRVQGLFQHGTVGRCGGRRCGVGRFLGRETGAAHNQLAEFLQAHAPVWIHLKDTLQDRVEFIGNGKDGLQKVAVFHEGAEGGIVHAGSLPGVAAASEVDQNHAQRPHIVGGGCITRVGLGIGRLALCGLSALSSNEASHSQGRGRGRLLTGRHVKGRTTSKVGRHTLLSGKSKVGQLGRPSIVHNQHILRLEIPMEDATAVAVLDGGQDLQKHLLGLEIIPDILALLGDFGKQVSLGAVLNDHVGALGRVQDFDQGNHIGMLARGVVQLDLAVLELALARIEADLVQGLDGILGVGRQVARLVHGAICADAKHSGQLDGAG
jgi:hypothetical protein